MQKGRCSAQKEMPARISLSSGSSAGRTGRLRRWPDISRRITFSGKCIVGASFGKDAADSNYPYAIGGYYNGEPVAEPDLTVEEIPAHTYVVFRCEGKMPEAFTRLYHQVSSEFFPASEYQPCGGTDFEVYPSPDVDDPGYTCEYMDCSREK